ncbi:lipase [Acrasis kona]|uniref:Lipase n=1 Tax=Acrasis kona TaxID=1008807 RepID=A0AAW2ZH58_9EUKA
MNRGVVVALLILLIAVVSDVHASKSRSRQSLNGRTIDLSWNTVPDTIPTIPQPIDTPTLKFAAEAYEEEDFNGQISGPMAGPWENILSTDKFEGTAVTKVFRSQKLQTLIVAYKGTSNLNNVVEDLKAMISVECVYNDIECGRVGLGFKNTFELDVDDVHDAIYPYIQKNYRIVFTGHSLGGATSTLALFYFATAYPKYKKFELVTYASPRVGNADFVESFSTNVNSYISKRRFVTRWRVGKLNSVDAVTMVPPQFYHMSRALPIRCPHTDPLRCHFMTSYESGYRKISV